MSKHHHKKAKGDCCKDFGKACPCKGDKAATPPAPACPAKPANDEKCPAPPKKGGGCCPGGGGCG
ncbi:MAG: hypothetical protein EPN97_06700 [Alphaproteobacteria bacterium]|nr:MAG: hypothetical protein EPN97_06700 [Alphaproteobacteria bacterium]